MRLYLACYAKQCNTFIQPERKWDRLIEMSKQFLKFLHYLDITFHTEPDIFGPPEQDAVVSLIFRFLTSAFVGRSINEATANVCRFDAQILKVAIL